MFLSLTLLALLTDAAFGYPDALFRRIGHPVTWIGRLITALDRRLNDTFPDATDHNAPGHNATTHGSCHDGKVLRPASRLRQRACGLLALVLIVALPVGMTLLAIGIACALLPGWLVFVMEALAASALIAQRSLHTHVRAVLTGLQRDGLKGGRQAVAMIVGRDPESLDESAVIRAAIESLAENFSDGIVAPVFWLAAFGLPGAVAYKAINTADSMIGHLSERHADFGRAAALADDCVNIPASRLTALWLILAGLVPGSGAEGSPRKALGAIRRDAAHHRSPNAGWPEAAMAGLLSLRLAGPRQYAGRVVTDSWMGDGRINARQRDLAAALRLFRVGCIVQAVFLLLLTVMFGWSSL